MRADRLVLDTNVLLSAAIQPIGKPAKILRHVLGSSSLIFYTPTFEEFVAVLGRPRFDRLVGTDARRLFLEAIEDEAEWVQIAGKIMGRRDLKDDKFIETALVWRADCLVTGDKDLLALRPAGESATLIEGETIRVGLAIVSPVEFLTFCGGSF